MSAMKNAPRGNKLVNRANAYMGMFTADPNNILGKLEGRQSALQAKYDKRTAAGKKTNKVSNKLNQINSTIGKFKESAPYQTQQTNNAANQNTQDQFQAIKEQGQFKPQNIPNLAEFKSFAPEDYSKTRQAAEQNVMESFNRQWNPEFERQDNSFREAMALQGVPEGSEKYNLLLEQQKGTQNTARQNAVNQAFSAGQGEQAQAFGQGMSTNQNQYNQMASTGQQMFGQQMQTYQMPYQNLQYMQPYYQGQMGQVMAQQNAGNQMNLQGMQNKWQGNQNAMDRDQQMKMQQMQMSMMGGHGGGGGGVDPNAGMNSFYDNYLNQFYQPQQQSTGNAAVNGFATGVAAGVSNSILGG